MKAYTHYYVQRGFATFFGYCCVSSVPFYQTPSLLCFCPDLFFFCLACEKVATALAGFPTQFALCLVFFPFSLNFFFVQLFLYFFFATALL